MGRGDGVKILRVHNISRALGGAEFYILRTNQILESLGHEVVLALPEDEAGGRLSAGFPEILLPRARGRATGHRTLAHLIAGLDAHRPDAVIFHTTVGFLSSPVLRGVARRTVTMKQVHDARVFCPRLRSKVLPARAGDPLPRICSYPLGWRCMGCLLDDRRGPSDVGPPSEHLREALIRWTELRALSSLSGVLCGSAYMRDELIRNGIAPDRLHVVGHLVPWTEASLPEAEHGSNAPVCVGVVGRWDGMKGMELALQALLSLALEHSFEAELIGGGPGLEAARAEVRGQGLQHRIRIEGAIGGEAIGSFYRRISLLVFPSLVPESFGAAGIEAQAHGVPVVGFRAGGVAEWLISGQTGLSVELGDEPGLRGAVRTLIEDADLRKTLGRRARARAFERFEAKVHVERIVEILESLVATRGLGDGAGVN